MEEQNILASDIQKTRKKQYDASCKALLAEKAILARLLKSCIPDFKDCSIEDIEKKYIEGDPKISIVGVNPNETNTPLITGRANEDNSLNEGKITYDIIFDALAPKDGELIKVIVNVEAQRDANPGYPLLMRALYYCSRMISAQYGREFINSEYQKIKKVCSIWICTDVPAYKQNTVNVYSIDEKHLFGDFKEDSGHYDLITAVIINMVKDVSDLDDNIIKLVSVLLSDTLTAEERMSILSDRFDIEMTEKIESEVSTMCNLSQGIEDRGIQKGIEKGKIEGKIESATALMKFQNLTKEQALKAIGISDQELPSYLALL